MPGRRSHILAGGAGAAVGVIVVLATLAFLPQTILTQGTVVVVPALTPAHGLPPGFSCGMRPCGTAGVWEVRIVLTWPASISGTLRAAGPYELALSTTSDVACSFSAPPPPCASQSSFGPVYEFVTDLPAGDTDLARLALGFSGATNQMPSAVWTLYLVNWDAAPLDIEVTTPVIVNPA